MATTTGGVVVVEPWRKQNIIQAIAALDIVIATLSVFYNGKTLLVIFDGLHEHGEEKNWPFMILVLSITFGIQLFGIVLAMMLFKSSREESSTLVQAICITKVWQVVSISFLFLLTVEFYVGLRTFEYNNYIVLFFAFIAFKVGWKIFTILYVQTFRKDLESGLSHNSAEDEQDHLSLTPVFRMVITSPENCDVDVSDNETDQQQSSTDIEHKHEMNIYKDVK